MKRGYIWALGLMAVMGVTLPAAPMVSDISPYFGSPGDLITLTGSGFAAPLSIRINGEEVPVEVVSATSAAFIVPGGLSGGPLDLLVDGNPLRVASHFWILGDLSATVDPLMEGRMAAIGSAFGDSWSEEGPYTVSVATARPTVVGAAASEEEALGLALVLPGETAVHLTPDSTLAALVALHPAVGELTNSGRASFQERLTGLPSYPVLRQYLIARLEAGLSWSGDPGFAGHYATLMEEYLRTVSLESGGAGARAHAAPWPRVEATAQFESLFSFENNTPRDLAKTNFDRLERLHASAGSAFTDRSGNPVLGVKFDAATTDLFPGLPFWKGRFASNPLDWKVDLYKLDPDQALIDSPAAVTTLEGSFSRIFTRLQTTPLDSVMVPAKPITAAIDPLGQLKAFLVSKTSPGNFIGAIFKDSAPKAQLNLPADESGIYLVRAFSGARMALQQDLLRDLPLGQSNDWLMFKWNMVVGVQDFLLSMLGSHPSLKDRDVLKLLLGISASSVNSVEREFMNRGEIVDQSQALGIAKVLLDTATGKALDFIKGQLLPSPKLKGITASKAGSRAIILTLVVNGSKLAERLLALTNAPQLAGGVLENSYMAMAVEETLVVVGDPWTPVVESFTPRRGHRGTEVRITGRNFSPVPDENHVTFGALTTDPLDPGPGTRAEVVSASETQLVVKIPGTSQSGPLTVARAGGSKYFDTTDLKDPFKTFAVVEDPRIISLHPQNPRPGSKVLIRGANLPESADEAVITFGEGQFGQVIPVLATRPDGFVVRLPTLEGPNAITVSINGRSSNTFAFTAVWPAATDNTWIEVNSNADTNARDGVITLREALMLANGELAYAELTIRPDTVTTGEYESDLVSGQPGSGQFDIIQLEVADIRLSAPLPKLSSRDFVTGGGVDAQGNLQLDTTIEANGVEGPGFVLDGIEGNQLTNFILRNFTGPGILVTGGASNNHIEAIVEHSQDSGIVLLDNALANHVSGSATGCAGHGVLLTGENVQLNTIADYYKGGYTGNQGWGIKIENGAAFNEVDFHEVRGNGSGGIHLHGEGTLLNQVGIRDPASQFGNPYRVVRGNGGPGLLVEAPDSRISGLQVSGNTGENGHGILIRSAWATGSQIGTVFVGYDRASGEADPNAGHGVFITDGATMVTVGDSGLPKLETAVIAGNAQSGLVISGASTTAIAVENAHIGMAVRQDDFWGTESPVIGNGQHGILFTGNTPHHEVALTRYGRVTVTGHTDGDGIRIEGQSNHIGMGSVTLEGNRTGLVMADQAWANAFGLPADSVSAWVSNHTEAGIVLSSSFSPAVSIPGDGTPIVPEGRNTVQNVRFFGNEVGIHLKAGAQGNLIGGTGPKDGNRFDGSTTAGILIDGVHISRPDFTNRIEGNHFEGPWPLPPRPADPLTAAPESVGILVRNGSSGVIIGGQSEAAGNSFRDLHHGVLIEEADGNLVRNNRFLEVTQTWPDGYSETYKTHISGVFLRNASRNVVGPGNAFTGCGTPGTSIGGAVVVSGGSGNRIAGNLIGVDPARTSWIGNYPDGIQVHQSAGNLIGGLHPDEPNVIVMNEHYGIRLAGGASTGNRIAGNHIGADLLPAPDPRRPNGSGGVLIESGARANIVGGDLPLTVNGQQLPVPAPNTLLYNSGDGVRVDGPGSTGNRILGNTISGHVSGLGIHLVNGGNGAAGPPSLLVEGGQVRGTTTAPDGSTVEVFSDPVDEGAVLVGNATVTAGTFTLTPAWLPYPGITATVTDLAGNTSPFAQATSPPATDSIRIARAGPVQERHIGTSGNPVEALGVEITGGSLNAVLDSLLLSVTGPTEALASVSLYQDLDGNGRLGPADPLLREQTVLDSPSEALPFDGLKLAVNPREVIRLLAVASLQDNAPAGARLSLHLAGPESARFLTLLTGTEIAELGSFPIEGHSLLVVDDRLENSFRQWLITALPPDLLDNPAFNSPDADPDGDGVANLVEFVFLTDPLDESRWPDIFIEPLSPDGLQVHFRHLHVPDDLSARFLGARDLSDWQDLHAFPDLLSLSTRPSPTGGESVTIRLAYPVASPPLFLKLALTR